MKFFKVAKCKCVAYSFPLRSSQLALWLAVSFNLRKNAAFLTLSGEDLK